MAVGVPRKDLSHKSFGRRSRCKRHKSNPSNQSAPMPAPPYSISLERTLGEEYFVKLLGPDQRNAGFLFKLWRTELLKTVASSAPFLTPMQQIKHEAS